MKSQTGILVGIIIVLIAALAFILGRQSAPSVGEPKSTVATLPTKSVTPSQPVAASAPAPAPPKEVPFKIANAGELVPLPGAKPFTETSDEISMTFLPTKSFRKMIEYRINPESGDSSCTKLYSATEKVTSIKYAYGFVIERFYTWNDREGKQEYITSEEMLPNALKGSLHDIVRQGRTVRITKERCGMGQIEGLVAVAP